MLRRYININVQNLKRRAKEKEELTLLQKLIDLKR
ncbi:unnamed protein product, partial [marine sediment metagenome]